MEISLVFVVCTMITGDLWERFEWGVWWTWEPRLTTYLILMLIVIAYFVLRNAIDEPERRGVYAAVHRHHRAWWTCPSASWSRALSPRACIPWCCARAACPAIWA